VIFFTSRSCTSATHLALGKALIFVLKRKKSFETAGDGRDGH
jgi:hypothetical protein